MVIYCQNSKKKKPVSSLCLQNLRRRMSHYQYLEKFWFDVKKKKVYQTDGMDCF